MKSKSPIYFTLIFLLIGMCIYNGILFQRNMAYREECKTLILQNDSILSLNLELQQALSTQQGSRKLALKKKS